MDSVSEVSLLVAPIYEKQLKFENTFASFLFYSLHVSGSSILNSGDLDILFMLM